jgi:hypothetical protein
VFNSPDIDRRFRRAAKTFGNPASLLTDIQAGWRPEGPRIVRPVV